MVFIHAHPVQYEGDAARGCLRKDTCPRGSTALLDQHLRGRKVMVVGSLDHVASNQPSAHVHFIRFPARCIQVIEMAEAVVRDLQQYCCAPSRVKAWKCDVSFGRRRYEGQNGVITYLFADHVQCYVGRAVGDKGDALRDGQHLARRLVLVPREGLSRGSSCLVGVPPAALAYMYQGKTT